MRVKFKSTRDTERHGIVDATGVIVATYPCGTKSVVEIGDGPENRFHTCNSAFEVVNE